MQSGWRIRGLLRGGHSLRLFSPVHTAQEALCEVSHRMIPKDGNTISSWRRKDHSANSPRQVLSLIIGWEWRWYWNIGDRATAVRDVGRQASISPLCPLAKPRKRNQLSCYTFLLLFLSLSVPLNLPPLFPYKMMVSLLPGNLVCDVVHTFIEPKRKKKYLWQDDDLPRWCDLVLRVRAANQSMWLCVYRSTVYGCVFTPGPVLRCCDAECHPAPASALQPEKPAVKLTALSRALTYTRSSLHRHKHNEAQTHTWWPQV